MTFDSQLAQMAIESMGWTLVHFVWQGTAVGLLFAFSQWALATSRAQTRYLFGIGCLLAILLLPILTYLTIFGEARQQAMLDSASLTSMSVAASSEVASAVAPAAQATPANDWLARFEGVLPWIVLAWGLGVLYHTTRVGKDLYRVYLLSRRGLTELSPELKETAARLAHTMGLRKAVRVVESALVTVPTIIGWLKPVVLLPTATLTGLTIRQIELVMAHEFGHVRRWDYAVNLLQVAIETLLFYHPVVSWISDRVRDEREKCCDDLVIARCGDHIEYAKALTNLETMRSVSMPPAIAATDGQLLQRIERIIAARRANPQQAVVGNTLLMLAVAVTLGFAGKLADPMSVLEKKRSDLADQLTIDLFTDFAALDEFTLVSMQPELFSYTERVDEALDFAGLTSANSESVAVNREDLVTVQPIRSGRQTGMSKSASPDFGPIHFEPVGSDERIARRINEKMAAGNARLVEQVRFEVDTSFDEPELTASVAPPALEPIPLATLTEGSTARPKPSILVSRAPDYPVKARVSGMQGMVELDFAVDDRGRPIDIRVVDALPRRVFDRAAVRALEEWRFDVQSVRDLGLGRISQRFDFNINGVGPTTADSVDGERECRVLTGTRICRSSSAVSLLAKEAAG